MEPSREVPAGPVLKPFTPQQAREIIQSLNQPVVFSNMVSDWPASLWKVSYLSCVLEQQHLRFRIGKKKPDADPQFETHCDYIEATLRQFDDWVSGIAPEDSGPFTQYDSSEFWAYADYKYLAVIFKDRTEMLQDVVWEDFGFPGRDGQESTLWIGSSGANTPCHFDSYGCNLVLQVEGRKTWHLFAPEDTPHLYPTRIPYEESSVFSKLNIVDPDLRRFPLFSRACPHVVTLYPGQVLYVPRHWWHYVESVDDVTVSVNSWIEQDSDHEARVEEAITRMLVLAFKSAENVHCSSSQGWLNPTESEVTSHQTNLQYLNRAVTACLDHHSHREDRARGHSGWQAPEPRSDTALCSKDLLFGPYLVPVLPKSTGENLRRGGVGHATKDEAQQERPCSQCTEAAAETKPQAQPARRTITSDEVLDCLVSPQVIHMVTELLLQKQAA